MSRALCALAAVAILASGCASRRAVGRLESEVDKLRTELAAMRVALEVTARDLARVTPQIQALDARVSELQVSGRAITDELVRLTGRADAADTALGETRKRVDALTTPTPTPTSTPSTSASVDRPRVPPVPAPSVAPAPSGAPAPPIVPAPSATPAPPAASAPSVAPAPPPAAAPVPVPVPARPAPRAGNPEQEYAAALTTFRAREHGQAVLDLLDFIAKYPKHALAGNAQYWIGEAYWAQRDYRQALVEFEKVFEHGPSKTPDALVKIGLCHLRLHDMIRAQQAWQRAVREYPRSEAAATAQSLLRTHAAARH